MTISYEKETCGRCGGTGQYSFNQVDGSRCYGCSGTGQRLTKRGKAAKAFADTLLNLRIDQVQVGQRVTDTCMGRRTTITVKSIEQTENGKRLEDGEWKPLIVTHLRGETHEIAGGGIMVRAIPSAEQAEQIMAYQANLTKAGKPRANRPASGEA